MISKKICLVGDFGVGKTSLIRKFVDRQFSDQYLSTVGVKISRKKVDLPKTDVEKNNVLQLLIWDLEGHTKFKAIAPSYLQGASGGIVVADVTREETIKNIYERLDLFLSVNPKSVAILALNKSDLVDAEIINQLLSKFEDQEDERVIATYSTSAKTGENVDEIFEKLSYRMLEKIG
ncbi:Rab family GTPase [Okeania sp. SIO2B9]|uniref:Rab family GTPase n=1 Tax=Okeania sp. SIO2B9 TaxID=2607782 RepID=UPI00142B1332|nr:Rab family GTPase [Okeania sp. SIO2B9]NES90956.1 GTP-binding protein [Okeania sp. SIO2B9]